LHESEVCPPAFSVAIFERTCPNHDQTGVNKNTLRLRETAHKLRAMMAAFSTVAGGVAAELEENEARDRLEE
jgi:hypothetical protein